ncbi:MAG TPA: hypothetical protein VLJ88_11640 [Propionibacteriaceae bacterium]|nr:hypothetical protein [Propionibacteriaceae bacterium]
MKTLNSGAFTQRTDIDTGDGSLTVLMKGAYDLKADAWRVQLSYSSDSPTFLKAGGVDPVKLTTKFLGLGSDGFMTMPGWPANLRGRWLQVAGTGAVDAPGTPTLGGIEGTQMDFMSAFSALEPIDATPTGSGWTLTGRVGADVAVQALGLAGGFRRAQVNVSELEGSGEISIDVAADGTPTELRINGDSITVTSSIPDQLRQSLPLSRGTVQLRELGAPVKLVAPTRRKLIDPSEMS